MENLMGIILQSVNAFCEYMYKLEQLDVERLRINRDYEIMNRKISITEKVALEHIEFQKMVLEKSLLATTEDLASLGASREVMVKAIGKFSESIMTKKYSPEERECAFKIIGLLSHELKQLQSDSAVKFKLLSANVIKALQNPLSSSNALSIGGK